MNDKLTSMHADYDDRVDELITRGIGCLFAGPGRGDCHNFLGLPEVLDETTTDVYGKPTEWCWSCWKDEKLNRLTAGNVALKAEIERLRSFEQIAFGVINLVNGEDFGGLSAEALGAILDCWAMEAEKANQAALEQSDEA